MSKLGIWMSEFYLLFYELKSPRELQIHSCLGIYIPTSEWDERRAKA